jgi:hypothetical protein
MFAWVVAASDTPSPRSILFGALVVAGTGVVITAVWKLLAFAAKSAFKTVVNDAFGGEFAEIRTRLDHIHDCVEERLKAVESRDSSALLQEVRRMADAVVARMTPARRTDPAGADHYDERALPPSEAS